MIPIYGIPNCDTVKKTLTWFKENNIEVVFHDFKKEGVSAIKLKEWLNVTPLEKLLNKKSTAFKNLSDEDKKRTETKDAAIKLMQANTNLIKRPVIEIDGTILNGFTEDDIKNVLVKNK